MNIDRNYSGQLLAQVYGDDEPIIFSMRQTALTADDTLRVPEETAVTPPPDPPNTDTLPGGGSALHDEMATSAKERLDAQALGAVSLVNRA